MKPIQRKSLAQEVTDTLKHHIKSGAFAIGSKLPTEPELMEKFGVGRSTIREAIRQLVQSGHVKVQQGLGTFVISNTGNQALDEKIQTADFAEIFEVRQLLELQIIEKACQNCSQHHITIMEELLKERKQYAESEDLQRCIEADIAFHTAIAESCGNSILTALYKTLSVHVTAFFYDVYQDTQSFLVSQKTHEDLVTAIQKKNITAALKAAQKIIGTL